MNISLALIIDNLVKINIKSEVGRKIKMLTTLLTKSNFTQSNKTSFKANTPDDTKILQKLELIHKQNDQFITDRRNIVNMGAIGAFLGTALSYIQKNTFHCSANAFNYAFVGGLLSGGLTLLGIANIRIKNEENL